MKVKQFIHITPTQIEGLTPINTCANKHEFTEDGAIHIKK